MKVRRYDRNLKLRAIGRKMISDGQRRGDILLVDFGRVFAAWGRIHESRAGIPESAERRRD